MKTGVSFLYEFFFVVKKTMWIAEPGRDPAVFQQRMVYRGWQPTDGEKICKPLLEMYASRLGLVVELEVWCFFGDGKSLVGGFKLHPQNIYYYFLNIEV